MHNYHFDLEYLKIFLLLVLICSYGILVYYSLHNETSEIRLYKLCVYKWYLFIFDIFRLLHWTSYTKQGFHAVIEFTNC